jgi:RNA polymerase sigma-70 factor (ECF subfamily)
LALRIDDVDLHRDRALVERFQQGDSDAFDLLYRRYFARLQRFCLKRVGDRNDAEEIAQEAFTRAFRALPSLGGERRFYPWMTVIAGRLCVDHHRRRGRSEPAAVIDLGAVDGGQEAIVERSDLPLLARALERLAPRHAEVLELREQRGWSYQDIANHYGVTVGTVEALLFRARKALKREYLAVAGGDRWAALGALPLLGAFTRRWSWMKAKAAAVSSAAGPALAPLGMAAVVGSVAVMGAAVLPGHTAGRDPVHQATVRMAPAAQSTAAPDAPMRVVAPATASSPRVAVSPSGAEVQPTLTGGPAPALPTTNTRVTGYDAANEDAEQQPVLAAAAVGDKHIVVASDPGEVIADATVAVSGQ